MSENRQRMNSVSQRLYDTDGVWLKTPVYDNFDRTLAHKKIALIGESVLAEGYDESTTFHKALEDSHEFTERTFDYYEGKQAFPIEVDRAFAVPTHTKRGDERHANGVTPFLPILAEEFGINADVRQKTLTGFPPTIIDTYSQALTAERRGVLVFSPLFLDMENDIVFNRESTDDWNKLISTLNFVINATARFVKEKLDIKMLGLGATIPKLTDFGKTIEVPGLLTTTGHGGTVHLIVETARRIVNETSIRSHNKIGIIGGAGSIGYSSTDAITQVLDDFEIHTYDSRLDLLKSMIATHEDAQKIHAEISYMNVLRKTNIIVTAVTRPIDLDIDDPNFELDLTGKVIIDDSQPGCFEKHQVEARGGKLVWVIGSDGSADGFLTRDNGYTFGDVEGLVSASSNWGCEAEVAAIASTRQYDKALRSAVTPLEARAIGELCRDENIVIDSFQAFGETVQLD